MSLLDPDAPPARRPTRWLAALAIVGAAAVGVYVLRPSFAPPPPEPESRSEASARPMAAPAPADVAPPPTRPRPAPEPMPAPEPAEAEAAPAIPTPVVPDPVRLRVTADVETDDVFIDRQFVGRTPFESSDVEPGRRRINVSASGYETQLEDVEIDADDLTEVDVRFQVVRLNARVPVVHKHRFGDCEGVLVADLDGIRFDTDDDDAFTLAFAELEQFEVDYLEHNLRLTRRGGRTYNFTDRTDNADVLFVFHREVTEARERLARGLTPAGG